MILFPRYHERPAIGRALAIPAGSVTMVMSGRIPHALISRRMVRWIAPFPALLFAAMLLFPSFVLLRFKVDQARIARELCVQRDLMEDMRTCHGECQLSERFKAMEEQAEAGFPAERIPVRYEPLVDLMEGASTWVRTAEDRGLPRPVYPLAQGHMHRLEPVPWVG